MGRYSYAQLRGAEGTPPFEAHGVGHLLQEHLLICLAMSTSEAAAEGRAANYTTRKLTGPNRLTLRATGAFIEAGQASITKGNLGFIFPRGLVVSQPPC